MALVKPDMSEVVELKPGKYKARIVGSDARESKSGSGTYVAWSMEVFGVEDQPELNGQRVPIHNTMTSGRGAFAFKNLVKATTGEDVPEGAEFDTEVLHGRELWVTVAPQKSNPQYMEVASVAPLTE